MTPSKLCKAIFPFRLVFYFFEEDNVKFLLLLLLIEKGFTILNIF